MNKHRFTRQASFNYIINKMKSIEIYCENNGQYKDYQMGTSLSEIAEDMNIQTDFPLCGALVNNQVKDLAFNIVKPKNIRFIDYSDPNGLRIYIRSLFFVLYASVKELYPRAVLKIDHSISNGYYCEIENLGKEISPEVVDNIKKRMTLLIEKDLPFTRKGMQMEKILNEYKNAGLFDKIRLYKEKGFLYSNVYYLNGHPNYLHGNLLPSTGILKMFDIEMFSEGLFLRIPSMHIYGQLCDFVHQDKLFDIFQQHKEWGSILNVSDIGQLNGIVAEGKGGDVIKISEALHEKKIAEIAAYVNERTPNIKLIFIAGPSSSGKTTFSKRLAVQLAVCGIRSFAISLDNYFVDREHTPTDKNGNYDFEALNAIDLEFFNKQLKQILNGEKIELPKFDFHTGKRFFDNDFITLQDKQVLIIEGIHALNPELIPSIDKTVTFKLFISALTCISIDDQTPISTTDNRIIRRMIRDSKYRGYSALDTIRRWPSVGAGEEKNIFPHQENADMMFNTALLYEMAVLKKYAEPLLKTVPENEPEYAEALRLQKLLDYFSPISEDEIPPTSLIREFLGGSSFDY